jgi:hypothetical protein
MKTGSETVAGHKCDVYKTKTVTVCVMPQAPGVMLRWASPKNGVDMVARKVTLNGPIPPAVTVLPEGLKWRKKAVDDADFMAQFAVRYLATPEATTGFAPCRPTFRALTRLRRKRRPLKTGDQRGR